MEKYGIYQVTIALPFRLNHVHCYLARQQKGWTILDAGLNRPETQKTWQEAFDRYSINPQEEINQVILTHYHPDHLGFSGALQTWTQAPVFMSKEGQYVAQTLWQPSSYERLYQFFQNHGLPLPLLKQMSDYDKGFQSFIRLPEQFHTIEEGQKIQLGELTYEAILTGGHAEGHLCFYNEEEKVFLGGDHLLRRITPNISYYGHGEENPLQVYMDSLQKLQTLDISMVIPGHGPVFHDAQERILEILHHHEERLEIVLDHIKGERTAYQICQSLFNRELTLHEQRFAMGETLAHLYYLVEKGEIHKKAEASGEIFFSR
ncbi:MBL fold metallo-hydrolase [Ammoniphilus sp. YIM 78166]|uniref:MBL fold metallo-hydrolase n=1 Tax=Ammoniphilus sp. YIM 78166 TaxID=1644106 RepID=UPI00107011E5|nr:MBL fold metallo-hydrolase [Ammoniphilus sp. YIM 78166]